MNRRLARLAAPAVILAIVVGTLASRPWSWFAPAGEAPGMVAIGGPFALVGSDGRIVTDADFRGRWMLVYFGYTRCPDACPMALNSVANALDRLHSDRSRIAPIFITVDPARDTPDVMGHYVALFDRQIIGLTGTQAQIDRVTREYRVYAARHPGKNGDYTMDHSSILYVMDKQGRFNSVIDGAADPADIAARLEKLDG